MDNSLGGIIKERRKAKKLTLTEVSAMSGVHMSHLGRIERGERFPSGHILKKLAEPLGFTETELLKVAGFMSTDETDDRLERFKKEVKREIVDALVALHKKIDDL